MGNEGALVEDEFKVGLAAFTRATNFSMVVVGITSYDPASTPNSFDGWLGFGPYTAMTEMKDINFMYSLKKQGYISHNLVSFILPRDENVAETGTIGMGVYDPKSHIGDLKLLKTNGVSSWALSAGMILYDSNGSEDTLQYDVALSESRTIKIDPQLPYVYLPDGDWDRLTTLMKSENSDLACTSTACGFSKACSDETLTQLANYTLRVELTDGERTVPIVMESVNRSAMIPGGNLGLGSGCWLPFFKSQGGADDTWYLGSIFMADYYFVLDMTPYDERGEDYIQIGIAERNDSYSQSEAQYNYSYPEY